MGLHHLVVVVLFLPHDGWTVERARLRRRELAPSLASSDWLMRPSASSDAYSASTRLQDCVRAVS